VIKLKGVRGPRRDQIELPPEDGVGPVGELHVFLAAQHQLQLVELVLVQCHGLAALIGPSAHPQDR
jgi:hypothetical protein